MERTMKKLFAALALATPLLANAYTWTDTYDAGPSGLSPALVTTSSPVSWQHNIADNGFNVGADQVSGYSLELWLSDDLNDLTWKKIGFFWLPTLEDEVGSVNQGGSTKVFEVDFTDLFGQDVAGTIS